MLNHRLPPTYALLPSSFFLTSSTSPPPLPFLPFISCLSSQASSLGLRSGTWTIDITAGFRQTELVEEGKRAREREKESERERDGSHHYTLTYIHFHPADWILCWGLRPITSGGGVLASQWRQPPFAELFYCLHTVFTDGTAAERKSEEDRERGDRWGTKNEQKEKKKQKGRRGERKKIVRAAWMCSSSLFALSVSWWYNCRQIKEG